MSRVEPQRSERHNKAECEHVSRRAFLKRSSGFALGLPWISRARADDPLKDKPRLDGDYLLDEAPRRYAATDYGGSYARMPLAVARPSSIEDIVRIISYANKRNLKVAMRGGAHSLSGQALVENGIVIDSGSLKSVRMQDQSALDAGPGALWGDVARETLSHGLIPPVMPDAMMLSVGGTLAVGGIGETSYRFGTQVDHVLGLDVVTGTGQLITCSDEKDGELFNMVLAGLGQCGIIVRARLRLVEAPKMVAMRTITYNDLDVFLADQARLIEAAALGPLNGRLTRDAQGPWQYSLSAGSFTASADSATVLADWTNRLRHSGEARLAVTPFWEYLDRRTKSITAGKARNTPNPALVVTMPAASTEAFVDEVLASPQLSAGIWFFEVSPKITARHRRPLQKMPASELAYELRMQRRASAVGARDHKEMLAANEQLVAGALERGGKVYPPFAPILSPAQWHEHYGAETWKRFAAAKKRFDPNNVLAPGAGIF